MCWVASNPGRSGRQRDEVVCCQRLGLPARQLCVVHADFARQTAPDLRPVEPVYGVKQPGQDIGVAHAGSVFLKCSAAALAADGICSR